MFHVEHAVHARSFLRLGLDLHAGRVMLGG